MYKTAREGWLDTPDWTMMDEVGLVALEQKLCRQWRIYPGFQFGV